MAEKPHYHCQNRCGEGEKIFCLSVFQLELITIQYWQKTDLSQMFLRITEQREVQSKFDLSTKNFLAALAPV